MTVAQTSHLQLGRKQLDADIKTLTPPSARHMPSRATEDLLPPGTQANAGRRAARTPVPRPPIRLQFDDLIHLESRTLAAVLREVNLNLLVLALAGSKEELIRRVCGQMPKRTARILRREMRRMGPTRLSDVEAAQHAVSLIAAKQLNETAGFGPTQVMPPSAPRRSISSPGAGSQTVVTFA
jgi:hypothetical protein